MIIARKMRDKYIPWSSILWAFAAGSLPVSSLRRSLAWSLHRPDYSWQKAAD